MFAGGKQENGTAAATEGFYYQALEEEATPALERLGGALGAWLGVPGRRLALADWAAAVDVLAELHRGTTAPVVAVIDELPYLLDRVPELSSLLQRAADVSRERSQGEIGRASRRARLQ